MTALLYSFAASKIFNRTNIYNYRLTSRVQQLRITLIRVHFIIATIGSVISIDQSFTIEENIKDPSVLTDFRFNMNIY